VETCFLSLRKHVISPLKNLRFYFHFHSDAMTPFLHATAASNEPFVHPPESDDTSVNVEHQWIEAVRENRTSRRNTCRSVSLSTTNPNGPTRERTRTFAVRRRRLTARNTVQTKNFELLNVKAGRTCSYRCSKGVNEVIRRASKTSKNSVSYAGAWLKYTDKSMTRERGLAAKVDDRCNVKKDRKRETN
jgi:hypothetical protein